MFSRDDLHAAKEAGIFKADQIEAFETFIAKNASPSVAGDEPLRFLSNFNDVFLTMGLGILLAGITGTIGIFAFSQSEYLIPLTLMVASFALSFYFTKRRRLLLPSMFLSSVLFIASLIFFGNVLSDNLDLGEEYIALWTIGATALLALVYYLIFRLPFSTLWLAGLTAMFFWFVIGLNVEPDPNLIGPMILTSGVVTMLAAIFFDARDPARISRLSDNGFWLHLVAAPQIILAMNILLVTRNLDFNDFDFEAFIATFNTPTSAIITLLLLVALALLSLALNRRALIVSGMLTFAGATAMLLRAIGVDGAMMALAPMLILGVIIVFLGAGWHTARRAVLTFLPTSGFWGRIFPPEMAHARLNE